MPDGRKSSRHSWGKKLWILLVNRKELLWMLSKEEQPRGTSVWDDKAGDGVLAQPRKDCTSTPFPRSLLNGSFSYYRLYFKNRTNFSTVIYA
jgi:hypothetical protein